jgi:hypothetical protein
VHHARNPRYIDRNHGGTLIVWDRLFGTFARERDEPVYGITKPLASFNPLWANLQYWAELWDVARRARRPLDRLRVLWMRPGWRPPDLGGPQLPTEVDRSSYVKFDVTLPWNAKLYVLGQFLAVLLMTTLFLRRADALSSTARLAGAALVVWSLSSLTGLLDRRPWAVALEAARLLVLALSAAVVPLAPAASAGLATLAGASGLWLIGTLRKGLPLPAQVR